MIVELLDLSSVRRLLCSWLVVGEFGWTVMLSTAIFLSSYMEVQKLHNSTGLYWLMRHFTWIYWWFGLRKAFQFIVVNSPLTVGRSMF